jgi:hypothetical protein
MGSKSPRVARPLLKQPEFDGKAEYVTTAGVYHIYSGVLS